MRTTIDIPDALFRKVKASAALEGKSLKAWLLRAIHEELGESNDLEKAVRIRLPIVKSKELSYSVSAKDVAEILDEEDCEAFARH